MDIKQLQHFLSFGLFQQFFQNYKSLNFGQVRLKSRLKIML